MSGFDPVVCSEPLSGNGAQLQQPPYNCPPGLQYLMAVSNLYVQQKIELMEAFTGFETANKYTVKNQMGENIYYAVEQSDCCTRNCCGPSRPFEMKIMDSQTNELIHINRPLACNSCWCPCCLQKIEVYAPPGTLVGTVEQQWSLCVPHYKIKDAVGETVLKIEGSCCTFTMCGKDVVFKVLSKDGQIEVGQIRKKWTGFGAESFTDADLFGVSFPMDLDVRMKAVMLGAVFLIDMMFFEKTE